MYNEDDVSRRSVLKGIGGAAAAAVGTGCIMDPGEQYREPLPDEELPEPLQNHPVRFMLYKELQEYNKRKQSYIVDSQSAAVNFFADEDREAATDYEVMFYGETTKEDKPDDTGDYADISAALRNDPEEFRWELGSVFGAMIWASIQPASVLSRYHESRREPDDFALTDFHYRVNGAERGRIDLSVRSDEVADWFDTLEQYIQAGEFTQQEPELQKQFTEYGMNNHQVYSHTETRLDNRV